jgi:hypothetical protein
MGHTPRKGQKGGAGNAAFQASEDTPGDLEALGRRDSPEARIWLLRLAPTAAAGHRPVTARPTGPAGLRAAGANLPR